jgi:hypothetical protein
MTAAARTPLLGRHAIVASTIEIGDAFPVVVVDDDASFFQIAIIIVPGHVAHVVIDELRAPQQAIRQVVIPRCSH